MSVVFALKVLGTILEQRVEEKRYSLACLLYSSGEVMHARVNLNVLAELSPEEALPTRRYPKYPASQGARKERAPAIAF